MQIYELTNPSDPIFFEADDPQIAAMAAIAAMRPVTSRRWRVE